MRLTEATILADLPLPHLAVVLDELFLVPEPGLFPEVAPPQTVADLARRTRLTPPEVISRLERTIHMSVGIEIDCNELAARQEQERAAPAEGAATILLDVREDWEFAIAHIPGSLLLAQLDLAELMPRLRAAAAVVAICHHGVRSFSAAMYLRQNGVPQAQSLAGGVDEWAQTIDRTMARY